MIAASKRLGNPVPFWMAPVYLVAVALRSLTSNSLAVASLDRERIGVSSSPLAVDPVCFF